MDNYHELYMPVHAPKHVKHRCRHGRGECDPNKYCEGNVQSPHIFVSFHECEFSQPGTQETHTRILCQYVRARLLTRGDEILHHSSVTLTEGGIQHCLLFLDTKTMFFGKKTRKTWYLI